jgi:hypothetical protein
MPKIQVINASVMVTAKNGWANMVDAHVTVEEPADGDPTSIRKAAINLLLAQLRDKLEAVVLPGT